MGQIQLPNAPESPNLFEGPNGAGKSTFVEAIELCLLESHNTSGESAEAMRPRETALAPSISVVFSHAGTVYRISKTFLDSPKALLERMRADGVYDTIAKGKAADERCAPANTPPSEIISANIRCLAPSVSHPGLDTCYWRLRNEVLAHGRLAGGHARHSTGRERRKGSARPVGVGTARQQILRGGL